MAEQQQPSSGYDIGASLSGSASSGASLSGATGIKGGGNYGGQSYGPGSIVNLSGPQGGVAISWPVIAAIAAAVVAGIYFFTRRR